MKKQEGQTVETLPLHQNQKHWTETSARICGETLVSVCLCLNCSELEVRVSVGEEQLERLTIKQTGTKLWKIHNGSVRNKFKTKNQTNKIAFMF